MPHSLRRCAWRLNQSRAFKSVAGLVRPFLPGMTLSPFPALRIDNASAIKAADTFFDTLGDLHGKTMLVHSSADGLGIDPTGIAQLIEFCVGRVGPGGTLLMPAFTYSLGQRALAGEAFIFDVASSPAETGAIPEYFRRRTGVIRSLHPTHSVAACGARAYELSAHHHEDVYPFGSASPFFALAAGGGMIIGLGVEWYRCLTSIHTAEDFLKDEFPVAAYEKDPVSITVQDTRRTLLTVRTLVHNERVYRYMDLLRLRKELIATGALCEMDVAGRPFFAADARMLHEAAVALARQGKNIYA